MKNIILFFLLALTATFASCTKDCPAPSNQITGDWFLVEYPQTRHIFNADGTVCRHDPESERRYNCFLYWYQDNTGYYLVDGPKKFAIKYKSPDIIELTETNTAFPHPFEMTR